MSVRATLGLLVALLLAGCGDPEPLVLEGRPGGPYRITLELAPAPLVAGTPTRFTERLRHTRDGSPVRDLQVVHERAVHNFVVARDFSSFAHVHHEDSEALTAADLDAATFHFDYTFPHPGHYRVVSEFTHHDRGWIKHFDLVVGDPGPPAEVVVDLAREKQVGPYSAHLEVSPAVPVAGFETELVLDLAREGVPVTDLQLLLGSEVHVALWRVDGEHFGHAHSYTPHMAAMFAEMHDRQLDPAARAERMAQMMVAMIDMPAELVYPGPRIPVRLVFPEPGVYAVFMQCAPGGEPRVFEFMVEVARFVEGMDTHIDSMVVPAHAAPHGGAHGGT
ncbi:MAG: hypothetical protein KDK06_15510 [Gammaproteobacteria bacterium]|nr:hypothetical protein [Gammaproteobacteria bacterium]